AELDLARPGTLAAAVRALAPRLVVNAGAYTAVDAAESDAETARRVNVEAPGVLAAEAARLDAPIVHFSTDFVFDGARGEPYAEGDETAPLGVYGRTKRDGERAVAEAGGAHLVLRTSWVYGMRGRNFLLTVLRLAAERGEVRVVDDQRGAPTWSRMAAEGTAAVLARCAVPGGFALPEGRGGVYHLSAAGETTWCGFARRLLALSPDPAARAAQVVPIATAEYPTPARRPGYSVLSGRRLRAHFGVALPPWEEQLALCMA
ncbi:MAG: rfbD, partial [Gemmatimonadetes bacterium]|nr:rfbD [Gemmatimonadota bacterium]